MNINHLEKVNKLCRGVQKEKYINAIFATDLGLEDTILLGIIINSPQKGYHTKPEIFSKVKDGILYEYHLFYTPLENYYDINFDNLNNEQIGFLELLEVSDIFIDKNGILNFLKNKLQDYNKKHHKI